MLKNSNIMHRIIIRNVLDLIEKVKGVHNMQYTLILINDTEKRLTGLHNTVLSK